MATIKSIRGSKMLVKIGDGADPEVFAHPCTLNSEKGLVFSAETNDDNSPDCDDLDAVPWLGREKRSKSASVTGSGTLHGTDQDVFFEWFDSEDSKNCKIILDVPAADGGRIYSGAWHLTQFEITGTVGNKVQANITLVSDGAVTKADNV